MTGKPVVLRHEAHRDVESAAGHYLAEAGERVAVGFEKAFQHISRNPASGSPRYAHELNLLALTVWRLFHASGISQFGC